MGHPVAWYLTITLLGWLAFPLAYHLLPGLKDRGYSLSRALGLLAWGYLFWLFGSLHVARNNPAGLVLAIVLFTGISMWAALRIGFGELGSWLRRNLGPVLVTETLFVVAFVAWAVVRAANPEAVGTEKPMELAFINAILRSPTLPPHDPWLSGYAISYYYFGYVLVAMLAMLTGTPGSIAFNLGIALVFALGAVGAYGLVYNLLNADFWRREQAAETGSRVGVLAALLGPLFLLLASNLEGLLHVLHSRGIFWTKTADGLWISRFWSWLDILDLNTAPSEPLSWSPQRFWWWWRASRVIRDFDLAGNPKEIINEFPFFSFLLADLHPHVLAIPFGLLAVGIALSFFLGGAHRDPDDRPAHVSIPVLNGVMAFAALLAVLLIGLALARLRLLPGVLGLILALAAGGVYAVTRSLKPDESLELRFLPRIRLSAFLLASIALGGLAFLNTWDFPTYVALCAAAFALHGLPDRPRPLGDIVWDFLILGMGLGLAGILLYLPFYLGFASQAGGPLPNLIYPTRGAQLWVMFGTLFVPIFAFLIYKVSRDRKPGALLAGLVYGLGIVLLLWVLSLAFGALIAQLPVLGSMFLGSLAAPDLPSLLLAALTRRFTQPGGWITLLGLLALSLAALGVSLRPRPAKPAALDDDEELAPPAHEPSDRQEPAHAGSYFAALLALVGTLLIFGPEFFFLRDLFGWRMNTIFKFYYQAWLILSILAAFATIYLIRRLRPVSGTIFGLVMVLLIGASLVYPAFSLGSKTNNFDPQEWTLDSTAYYTRVNQDETAAIRWLMSAPPGPVAEAVPADGGSYTEFARVATFSGQPGVLGWVGHENQWRGSSSEQVIGTRRTDLERLYCTRDWNEALDVLERYNIRYVYIGGLERMTYNTQNSACPLGLVENKFIRNMIPVFQSGGVVIYEYDGSGND